MDARGADTVERTVREGIYLRDFLLRFGSSETGELVEALAPFENGTDTESDSPADARRLYLAFQNALQEARTRVDPHTLNQVLNGKSPYLSGRPTGASIGITLIAFALFYLAWHFSTWSVDANFRLQQAQRAIDFPHEDELVSAIELHRMFTQLDPPPQELEPYQLYVESLARLENYYRQENDIPAKIGELREQKWPLNTEIAWVTQTVQDLAAKVSGNGGDADPATRNADIPALGAEMVRPSSNAREDARSSFIALKRKLESASIQDSAEDLSETLASFESKLGLDESTRNWTQTAQELETLVEKLRDDDSPEALVEATQSLAELDSELERRSKLDFEAYLERFKEQRTRTMGEGQRNPTFTQGSGLGKETIRNYMFRLKMDIDTVHQWYLPIIYGMLGSIVYCFWTVLSPDRSAHTLLYSVLRTAFAGVAAMTLAMLLIPSNTLAVGADVSRPFVYLLCFIFGYSIEVFINTLNNLNQFVTASLRPKESARDTKKPR